MVWKDWCGLFVKEVEELMIEMKDVKGVIFTALYMPDIAS
jgi:hypothetical protein